MDSGRLKNGGGEDGDADGGAVDVLPDEEEGHVFGVKGFDAFAKFIVDGYVCTKFIYGRLSELRKFALCDFGEINERAAEEGDDELIFFDLSFGIIEKSGFGLLCTEYGGIQFVDQAVDGGRTGVAGREGQKGGERKKDETEGAHGVVYGLG